MISGEKPFQPRQVPARPFRDARRLGPYAHDMSRDR